MFLDASKIIGFKRNIIDEELQYCFYDVQKMAPSVEGIKRFLDFHYGEKNPDINKSASQSVIND